MKKQILLCLFVVSFTTIKAQIDTLGVYYLTDGGGDPTIKSAHVYANDLDFTNYTRVGVTSSSGSGFFVSKGFPYGGADYDAEKYHTFTVTPQNDATLYINKFSMNHKRSGSSPNPGNTVNFKCVVSYEDKEYVFGTGTTLNPTAWFYADNLKILTKEPVTFKLYAKDLFDASQSWMQRRVSLIGASIPSGVDPEEIIGPLDSTYTEVIKDYINPLTFYKIDAEGQLAPPYVYDMSGMPVNYVFIVNNDVDLSNVIFKYHLPAGTTLEYPMPNDFSATSKQTITLKSSWGNRKANITVKKINAASSGINLKFDNTFGTHQWVNNTIGWIANNISLTENSNIYFDKEDGVFVLSSVNAMKYLSFEMNRIEIANFNGIFTIEISSDGTTWDYLLHFNSCNPIPSNITKYSTELTEGIKYVRFLYDCQNNRQNIKINNVQLSNEILSVSNGIKTNKFKLFPNPAKSQITVEPANDVNELCVFSTSGILVKKISEFSESIPISDLQQGVYVCRILSKNGNISALPLVIQ